MPNLVSVIIPNYNHAAYVADAIRSVLGQTFRNFEIIVVDDGSTDNSREVISGFGSRVHAIWQENRGLSAARNAGIRVAEGTFVGVLDADDMYEPNYLSTLVPILEAYPDAQAVYCGYQFVDHHNHPLPQREARLVQNGQLYQALVEGNFLVPESMLVRRHCYEMVGPFDETLRALEDLDMWLRISSRFNVLSSTEILTRHRVLTDSMSADTTRMFEYRLAVIRKHFGLEPPKYSEWTEAQRWAYGHAYLTSTVEFLQSQNQTRAYNCILEMAKIYPDLLVRFNTFFQIGLCDQSKGFLGDLKNVNSRRNAHVLFGLLDRLFNEPEFKSKPKRFRHSAYAKACFALGTISYGGRRFRDTRNFLFRAVRETPRLVFDYTLVLIFLKSLAGVRFVNWLKVKKQQVMSGHLSALFCRTE